MSAASQNAPWPFEDAKNVATVTVRQIIREGRPILLVSHDAEDGSWRFLTGDGFSTADAMLVALHEVVERDPGVLELADLPLGWVATRPTAASPWSRSPEHAEHRMIGAAARTIRPMRVHLE